MNIIKPTFDDIMYACVGIHNQIKETCNKIDLVIGISRGGLVPGIIL